MANLTRLLKPKSMAVIGGGAWCEAVIKASQEAGFDGPIWSIHPKRKELAGLECYKDIDSLPSAPDVAFIGVNRHATINAVGALAQMGAGGAVCFASGFAETQDGETLNQALLEAAGTMPILGPNCYGFLNYLDGAMLWPDIHGGRDVTRGVAIIGQSSNILLNLTMQKRGLPIAYVIAAGNQAQIDLAEMTLATLEDERVTAIGLHIEGIRNIAAMEQLAQRAAELKKPITIIKVGQSEAAQAASLTHTASLSGSDAAANALFQRLGMARAENLSIFLENLKIGHCFGRHFAVESIASMSCSGGEASLMADLVDKSALRLPNFSDTQKQELSNHLGPLVSLTNPLDYHTQIWRDRERLEAVYSTVGSGDTDISLLVLDFPREDRASSIDWQICIDALEQAAENTASAFGVVASLPETMPERVAERLLTHGIVPLNGMESALVALSLTNQWIRPTEADIFAKTRPGKREMTSESAAKAELKSLGLSVPRALLAETPDDVARAASELRFPLVLKAMGHAHKSEAGALALNLQSIAEVKQASGSMKADEFLIEEMVTKSVVELLVSITHDPAHGYLLTIGAGGVQTEILNDVQHLLVPASTPSIEAALNRLRIAPLLHGYRGAPVAAIHAIIEAIHILQNWVIDQDGAIHEIEINPLIVTNKAAFVADALLVRISPHDQPD